MEKSVKKILKNASENATSIRIVSTDIDFHISFSFYSKFMYTPCYVCSKHKKDRLTGMV